MTIEDRLSIYGPSTCPICGNPRETVFGKRAGELVCRAHPGHPLYQAPGPVEDRLTPPAPVGSGRIA